MHDQIPDRQAAPAVPSAPVQPASAAATVVDFLRRHLSAAEGTAAAGVFILIVVHLLPATVGSALEYQRAGLMTEPWRAITGHLVHVNTKHLLLNALVWLVFARLFSVELPPRAQMLAWFTGAATISLGLAVAYPDIGWYRGASGVLYTLYFFGAIRWLIGAVRDTFRDAIGERLRRRLAWSTTWLPAAVFAGGWIKIIVDLPADASMPYVGWLGAGVVPQAHLFGAIAGTLLGAAFAYGDRRGATTLSEQK